MKIQLRSLNEKELIQFLERFRIPKFRASQILSWLHHKQVLSFAEMKNVPKDIQEKLKECSDVSVLELVEVVGTVPSPLVGEGKDGGKNKNDHPHLNPPPSRGRKGVVLRDSFKYLMKTADGHLLESVLIVQSGRKTVCVSTQLGCRMVCSFCASGKGKFGRNLSAGEIVEQVSQISRHLSQVPFPAGTGLVQGVRKKTPPVTEMVPITNIVFMGMGEPLDNYEATMRAIEILTAEWGFNLGGRRITVSTCGITPMIERFVEDSRGRVRLSISLHSSDQETRTKLVPINKKYKLDELIKTLEKIHKDLKREITFEYTLIRGVNDSIKEAQGVSRIASRLGAKVNIIPYNPIREMDYKSPDPAQVEMFRKLLENKHVHVTVRQTAGRDIDAACGQLRLDRSVIPSPLVGEG